MAGVGMLAAMNNVWHALRYALKDSLRPQVLAWSMLPVACIALVGGVALWWWGDAWQAMTAWWVQSLQAMGLEQASDSGWLHGAVKLLAALSLGLLAAGGAVLLALLVSAAVITPPMVRLVAQQRFPSLHRQHGANWLHSLVWAAGSTALALVALLVSLPLWLIPPLMLVLPAVIGGWLTYRILVFDVLAEHATKAERQALLRRHRVPLLLMGMACGFVSALPGLLSVSFWWVLATFWLLIPLALCFYAWTMAWAALWFAHFALESLAHNRVASVNVPTESQR